MSQDDPELPGIPPTPTDLPHVLVEPRLVAAMGLMALGYALGIGLMLARLFMAVGLSISLASSLGVIWLYWQPLLSAYNALSKRTIYDGVGIKELAVAIGMLMVLVPLSVSIFLVNNTEARRAEIRTHLLDMYVAAAPFAVSHDDWNEKEKRAELLNEQAVIVKWETDTAKWIENNLGIAAKERFEDMSDIEGKGYGGSQEYTQTVNGLVARRRNLAKIIETPAYDR